MSPFRKLTTPTRGNKRIGHLYHGYTPDGDAIQTFVETLGTKYQRLLITKGVEMTYTARLLVENRRAVHDRFDGADGHCDRWKTAYESVDEFVQYMVNTMYPQRFMQRPVRMDGQLELAVV